MDRLCLLLSTSVLQPTDNRECQLKVSIAKWLNATADEHGCGDKDGSDKNFWKEHMLWS